MWKFFLTCPMLACSCSEFILHILCWLLDVGSFYYTSCAWCFMCGVSLTHPVSLPHPLLTSLCGEFLLHILSWLLHVKSFSYISHAGRFMWGISLTFPCWLLYVGSFSYTSYAGEFLLHVPCWLYNVGSFSYTSHAGFLMWVVSLTCSLEADGCFMLGFSITHPVLGALCVEFLLHVPCWLYNVGSFSYTSHAGFLMWVVSLTCSLEADGCFMLGFSITHPMDVLTIPTAYQKTKNWTNKKTKMISLSVGVSPTEREIILVFLFVQFLKKKINDK